MEEVSMDMAGAAEAHELDLLDVQVCTVYWGDIERRIGSLFARSEARARAITYLAGLLSPVERKNSWQLAEISGDATPYAFQHLLGRADWNPDALRDRLRTYITNYLEEPDAVGVLDETGFLKKGTRSVGVARQYSGTAMTRGSIRTPGGTGIAPFLLEIKELTEQKRLCTKSE